MDCLLHGYCKRSETKSIVPTEIIDTCLSFYDSYIYISISKQQIEKIITDYTMNPMSTANHTINGFSFKLTAEIFKDLMTDSESEELGDNNDDENHYYDDLHINMTITKLPLIFSERFSVITRYARQIDKKMDGYRHCDIFNCKCTEYKRPIVATPISALATAQSIEFVFDINIIDKIDSNTEFEDISYEWIFDEKTLNLMNEKWKLDKMRVYSPQDFGWNNMFYLMLECIENKLSLNLCVSQLINMKETLRIDSVNVMLLPFDAKGQRKIWRTTDIELIGNSPFEFCRRKRWEFDKQQMIDDFSTHSLVVELHGIHLDSKKIP